MIPTGLNESVRLSQLPAVRDALIRIRHRWQELSDFLQALEREFGRAPELSDALVDAISCAKIECIRFALDAFFEIKARVGSYSVQEDSPFGTIRALEASLYCQRFAEGDAAVLEQKMARDHIKHYAKAPWLIVSDVLLLPIRAFSSPAPLLSIAAGLAKARLALTMLIWGGRDKQRATTLWFESHELVTQVARLQSLLTIQQWIKRK
jgi:hypothetical protein